VLPDPASHRYCGRHMNLAPVRRSKAEAQATYGRRSRGYERLEGRFERHARELGERRLAVQPGEVVLEIGSGPGASLVALARAVEPTGRVVGLDLSPGMHEVAQHRLSGTSLTDRVVLVLGDGAYLPVCAASCDAVFSSFTVELFDTPELPIVLREARRVLRREGRLGLVSLELIDPPPLMMRAYLLAHRLMPRLADCRPIPVIDLVQHAGFVDLDCERTTILGIPVTVVTAHVAG
jgi:ubiquinone/menaquinone biosynthesis C-methylase UbiE